MTYDEQPKADVESPRDVGDSTKETSSPEPELIIDEKTEQKLVWKLDIHILPFVVLLYLFSFLDRGARDRGASSSADID